ncbi:MAG: hypothetical protein SGILL_003097 [Bacillariaceae sp.]
MSYQPYATGNSYGQKKTQGGSSASNYNPYQNASPAPAPAPASSYNPYQNAPSTTTTSNNVYGATAPSSTSASSYNPYQNVAATPAPASMTTSASSYNPYENVPKQPTTSNNVYGAAPPAASTASRLPDFSQALDVPPPSNHQTTYGAAPVSATKGYGDSSAAAAPVVATAYPMGSESSTAGKTSLVNSMTYTGGPTNGIVSEGNPVKCHKVDYEIKGHEMQLVE